MLSICYVCVNFIHPFILTAIFFKVLIFLSSTDSKSKTLGTKFILAVLAIIILLFVILALVVFLVVENYGGKFCHIKKTSLIDYFLNNINGSTCFWHVIIIIHALKIRTKTKHRKCTQQNRSWKSIAEQCTGNWSSHPRALT